MAIEVTEDWKGTALSKRPPWSATRVFCVTGTTSADEAVAADGIPAVNAPFSSGSSLKCEGAAIESRDGPAFWRVRCTYIVPTMGDIVPFPGDPLNAPLRFRWSYVPESEPTEVDLDGRTIQNTARRTPKQKLSRNVSIWQLAVIRNEPYFDLVKANDYSGAVNNSPLSLGPVTFATQHVLCASIQPEQEFVADASYVSVVYTFIICPYLLKGLYPFQYRIPNVSDDGYYGAGILDNFTSETASGSGTYRPRTDVRIGWNARELVAVYGVGNLKVGDGNASVASPVAFTYSSSDTATDGDCWKYETTDYMHWVYYKASHIKDLSALGL